LAEPGVDGDGGDDGDGDEGGDGLAYQNAAAAAETATATGR